MTYTIDYSGITDLEEKENMAIEDCKEYLGQEFFNEIVTKAKEFEPMNIDSALFHLSFIGIQGYPAKVFAKRYFKLKEV